MGFFSRLFHKKEKEELTFDYEKLLDGLSETKEVRGAKRKVESSDSEQELVECCEHLMESINNLKAEKREYEVDTNYLKDTDIIEELPEKDRNELAETAGSIEHLAATRKTYMDWESKSISQERMVEFDRIRDDIPDAISRLKSNEAYQTLVKHDMQKLTEERNLWGYELKSTKRRMKNLRTALVVTASLFIACVVLMGTITLVVGYDMTIPLCIAGIIVVAIAFAVYYVQQRDEKNLKQIEVNLNHAIELLNRMKTKYVSITNAVDYAQEKYKVHKSSELEYLYNEYLKVSRERDQFERPNADLEYYNRVLVRQLSGYHLYDATIWIYQASALIDPKEMVEVRHSLLEHRQTIRDRMDKQMAEIKESYDRMKRILNAHPQYKEEVADIAAVVEQLIEKW